MPGQPCIGIADGLAIGIDDIRQEQNLRIPGPGELPPGTDFQGTKAPQVLRCEGLIAENDNGMGVIRLVDGAEREFVQRLGKINTNDFCPQRGTAWTNGHPSCGLHLQLVLGTPGVVWQRPEHIEVLGEVRIDYGKLH